VAELITGPAGAEEGRAPEQCQPEGEQAGDGGGSECGLEALHLLIDEDAESAVGVEPLGDDDPDSPLTKGNFTPAKTVSNLSRSRTIARARRYADGAQRVTPRDV